jgi:hypothetical protein
MNSATRKLCAIHLAANALLLWLGYEWLDVGESTGLRLAWSALDALAILALVCWLYGATFVFFRSPAEERRLNDAFRTALRHVAPLLVAAIAVIAIYGVLVWAAAALGTPAFKVASYITLKLRKPVKPATVLNMFRGVVWVVRWMVLPVALLPMAPGIAERGWRGFGEFTGRRRWRYWVAAPVLLLAGLELPALLLGWIPRGGFALELISFSFRALFAYLLLVGSLVYLTARTALNSEKRVSIGAFAPPA